MPKYISTEGGYLTALKELKENGGQLFTGNKQDSAHTLLKGSTVTTYWEPDSNLRKRVLKLSEDLGFDGLHMTPGRLAKAFLRDVVGLQFEGTKYDTRWEFHAEKAAHWHYQYVVPNQEFYAAELDIKSAYATALFKGDSLLWNEGIGYLDDGGAIRVFEDFLPDLPKWFRLVILGVISSHQMQYLIQDKEAQLGYRLCTNKKITYGAAFNATHRAIARLYKMMEKSHQILDKYLIRAHTDSLLIDMNCPPAILNAVMSFIEAAGYKYSWKGIGKAYFFDLNTGFLGGRFIGATPEVKGLMRENGIKMARNLLPQRYAGQWGFAYEKAMEYKTLTESQPIHHSEIFEPSDTVD